MTVKLLRAVLAFALACCASAADAQLRSASGFVEVWPGTLPVVLSAPHGGTNKPPDVPDRTYGTMNLDSFTRPLAYAMREAFIKKCGAAPTLVVCLMSRTKVDCNRDIVEGAQSNRVAEQVWREFNDAIIAAEKSVLSNHPHGLYFDIHAHGHEAPHVELGYGLTAAQLRLPDEKLNAPELERRSTVRLLSEKSPVTFAELMRGASGLGALLEARGIAAKPSSQRVAKEGEKYFSGGYNVRTHGSSDGAGLDAIQLETPGAVRSTREAREKFAAALADATVEYLAKHYAMKLPSVEAPR